MAKKLFIKFILFFAFLASGAFLFFIWIRFVEPNLLKLETVFLSAPDFGAQDLRILHLSDFHTKEFGHNERQALAVINKTKPDFIFITGDLVDWKTSKLQGPVSFWEEIVKQREGRVFVVLGNHEHRNPLFETIVRKMSGSGLRVLINQSVKISLKDDDFYLIGLDDPHTGLDNYLLASQDVPEESFKIVLAHSPEAFNRLKEKDVFLVLAGHTHGCQLNLPFVCEKIIPLQHDKHYRYGLFREKETYLYVTRGVGETFLPLRFNAFPEATLIVINAQE